MLNLAAIPSPLSLTNKGHYHPTQKVLPTCLRTPFLDRPMLEIFWRQIFPNFGGNVANAIATFECFHIAYSQTLIFHCKSLFSSMFDVEDVNNTKYWHTHMTGYASKKYSYLPFTIAVNGTPFSKVIWCPIVCPIGYNCPSAMHVSQIKALCRT